ncbi:MAG: hypothetical protein GY771_07760 [bacterium]|nr:hypothetical protein [bacterium]
MENIINVFLLAVHNIALVGCVAAPFYNLKLVNQRGKHGQKLYYELDKVVEDTIQGNEPYCWAFIILLYATGFAFPFVYYAFHGQFSEFSTIALVAFIVKHVFVFGIVAIAFYITFMVNPKIKALFATFKPDATPADGDASSFFALRATRKKLCKICFAFGIIILLVSPILRFY